MPAWLPAAITGGASLLGGLFGMSSQQKANRDSQNFSREMWERQNAVNDANWHRDNEYNSPANQRRLIEQAGLNPYLMYDKGTTHSQSSAPPAPSAQTPNFDAPRLDLGEAARSGLSAYYDARLKPAQLDNLKGATENAAASTAADVGLKAAQSASVAFDTGMKQRLSDISAEAAQKSLDLVKADLFLRTNQGHHEADKNQLTIETMRKMVQDIKQSKESFPVNMQILRGNAEFQKFKSHLQSMGLTESDGVLWRLFGNLFKTQPVSESKPYNW